MCDISYDGDRASAWSERRIKRARKDHQCQSCCATIRAGRAYWRRSWVSDGTADDEACCDACWKIAEAFGEEHRFTPCPSNLLEYVAECAGDRDVGHPVDPRWARAAGQIRARRTRVRNKRAAEGVLAP